MIKLNVYGCYIPPYLVGRINNYEKDLTYNVELNIMNQYLLIQCADP